VQAHANDTDTLPFLLCIYLLSTQPDPALSFPAACGGLVTVPFEPAFTKHLFHTFMMVQCLFFCLSRTSPASVFAHVSILFSCRSARSFVPFIVPVVYKMVVNTRFLMYQGCFPVCSNCMQPQRFTLAKLPVFVSSLLGSLLSIYPAP
jgi:hypothetical protein